MNNVIKRDGEVVPFEASKIENAILKAFTEVDGELSSYATEKAKSAEKYKKNKENQGVLIYD